MKRKQSSKECFCEWKRTSSSHHICKQKPTHKTTGGKEYLRIESKINNPKIIILTAACISLSCNK
ncbi:CLUMA_CG007825, isoform A [Clunio marinus]|uniref:CLUMA_CG007825, isoform A n=1 Tax=Clunio marinus TaxID=568069 RepID=A0A1J1I5U2_9DIPT|nr:CLUMA_CG007825, isoform A [Clunio marinus]